MRAWKLSGLMVAGLCLAACLGDGARLYRITLTRDAAFLAATNIPQRFRANVPETAETRTVVPGSAEDGPLGRVVVVFGANSDNASALDNWSGFRDTLDAAILAVDAGREETAHWGQYYFILHLLRDLKAGGIVAPDANILLAASGGGVGSALSVANLGGARQFDGVLAVGADTRLISGLTSELQNQDALRLPITVLTGAGDPRGGRGAENMLQVLRENGFSRARHVEYEGGRLFPTDAALASLMELFERVGSRPGIHR